MPITVKLKSTGQLGIIPEDKFDPNLFEQVNSDTQQPQNTQNISSKAGNLIMNMLKGAAQPFVNTGKRIGGANYELKRQQQMAGGNIANVLGNLLNSEGLKNLSQQSYQKASSTNPFLKTEEDINRAKDPLQIAKDSAALLSYGIPVGGATRVAGRTMAASPLVGGAAAGALSGFGSSGDTPEEMLGSMAMGGVMGGAGGVILNKILGGSATGSSKNALERTGQRLTDTAKKQRLNKVNLRKWGDAEFFTKLDNAGLGGFKSADDLAIKAQSLLDDNVSALDNAFANVDDVTVSINSVLDDIDSVIAKKPAGDAKAPYEAVRQQIIDDFGGRTDIPFKEYLQLRRNYGALGKWKLGGEIGPGKAGAYESVYKTMNKEIDNALKNSGYEAFRQNNRNITTAIDALDVADEAMKKVGNSSLSLTDIIAGTGGGVTGGPGGAIMATAGKKLITSPGATELAGKTLQAVGGVRNPLQSILSPGMKSAVKQTAIPLSVSAANTQGNNVPQVQTPNIPAQNTTIPTTIPSQSPQQQTPGVQQISPQMLMMGRMMLSDSDYSKLEDLYNIQQKQAEPQKDTRTEAQVARDNTTELIKKAVTMFNSNPNIKMGMIAGPTQELLGKFNMADQTTADFNALVSNLQATIAKARGGTSFTPNEQKMLDRYTPKVGDSRQEIQTKLSALYKQFVNQ